MTWSDIEHSEWLQAALILVAVFVFEYLLRRMMNGFIKRASARLNSDPTNFKFLSHALRAVVLGFGFTLAISRIEALHTLTNSVMAGAGVLAVAVGFASQNALSNIISGMFIVLFKPFRVHDKLQIQGKYTGVVEDITLRHTVLRDAEQQLIIIPNTVMNSEIILNSLETGPKVEKWLELHVCSDADVKLARSVIEKWLIDQTEFQLATGKTMLIKVAAQMPGYTTLRIRLSAETDAKVNTLYHTALEELKSELIKAGIKWPDKSVEILKH